MNSGHFEANETTRFPSSSILFAESRIFPCPLLLLRTVSDVVLEGLFAAVRDFLAANGERSSCVKPNFSSFNTRCKGPSRRRMPYCLCHAIDRSTLRLSRACPAKHSANRACGFLEWKIFRRQRRLACRQASSMTIILAARFFRTYCVVLQPMFVPQR